REVETDARDGGVHRFQLGGKQRLGAVEIAGLEHGAQLAGEGLLALCSGKGFLQSGHLVTPPIPPRPDAAHAVACQQNLTSALTFGPVEPLNTAGDRAASYGHPLPLRAPIWRWPKNHIPSASWSTPMPAR